MDWSRLTGMHLRNPLECMWLSSLHTYSLLRSAFRVQEALV